MKIYINNIDPIVCKIDNTYKKSMIYSDIGIYCNNNKKLTLIETKDENYQVVTKNNYEIILDKSKEVYLDYILHIPYNHICSDEIFEKTHIGYDIFYIKHYYFDQISHYFEVEQFEDYMYDIIFTFLSSK
jgi:hypothetical protein